MKAKASAVLCATLAASCGPPTGPRSPAPARQPAPAPAPPVLPLVEGRPVYDVPIDQADVVVKAVWRQFQELLADGLETPAPEDRERWMREEMKPWFERRAAAIGEVAGELEALRQGGPRDRLLAALFEARVYDEIATAILDLDRSLGAASPPKAQGGLAEQAVPYAQRARARYRDCLAALEEADPLLGGWRTVCEARAQALAPIADRPVAPKPAVPSAAPLECDPPDPPEEIDAPPPDRGRPREIAVVYDGTRLAGRDRARLLQAATAWVKQARPEPLVPARDLGRAERLVKERRWSKASPVCRAAPSLLAILAEGHRHLLVAHVATECFSRMVHPPSSGPERSGEESCELRLFFSLAGARDEEGLPDGVEVKVEGDPRRPASWLEAAARLGSSAPAVGFLGVIGGPARSWFSVGAVEVADPFLAVRSALQARAAELRACHPGQDVASLDVAWTISPAGAASGVKVDPITAGDADVAKVSACVARVLAATPFRCPRGGGAVPARATVCIRK